MPLNFTQLFGAAASYANQSYASINQKLFINYSANAMGSALMWIAGISSLILIGLGILLMLKPKRAGQAVGLYLIAVGLTVLLPEIYMFLSNI
jgi:hypothetical protein